MQRTLIAILNWNNAPDTIACIGSVMELPGVHIAVMDNNSDDGSYQQIRAFLQSLGAFCKRDAANLQQYDTAHRFTLIRSSVNSGFAGGNNAMLRAAMHTAGMEYAWLLNNDAVAASGALQALIQTMEREPAAAFAGSVVLDGTRKELVQCCGVRYYKWFGVSKLVMKDTIWNEQAEAAIPHGRIDFQNGASVMVRLGALKVIGLMDERFFLYSEEHDWQETAKEKGYVNVLSTGSVVWHKGSVSTSNRKHLFFYYYNKSGVIFARKHDAWIVRIVSTVLRTGVLLVRSRLYPRSIYWGLKGIFEGWLKPLR